MHDGVDSIDGRRSLISFRGRGKSNGKSSRCGSTSIGLQEKSVLVLLANMSLSLSLHASRHIPVNSTAISLKHLRRGESKHLSSRSIKYIHFIDMVG